MASGNLSDMYARRLIRAAVKSLGHSRPDSSASGAAISLNQLAKLSTFDGPAAPTIEENSYYERYKTKLEKIQRAKPKEYEAALGQIYGSKDKAVSDLKVDPDIKGSSVFANMRSTSSETQGIQSDAKSSQRKGLDSIIKLELLKDKTVEEINQIWTQYYAIKDNVVFATIPVEKYNRLKLKGNECPVFIYAVPREQGYEFMLGQCANDDWYYTPLLAYQTHGDYAPYSLSIQHYTELADSKGVVLMKGEIAQENLKPEQATLLIHQSQLMYGSEENFKTVQLMHSRPDEFKHMEIIGICQRAGLF